ncbi:Protein P [Labeo rohita]|uniref:Protein P n=1 Tax=Labeo rohita TaxID=84645 RepID=A0ABQ8L275_LABRO|nr:Protein P [Labeo rohita]
MKTLGLRLNAKKSVLSPSQRSTYLGVVWDSTTMQARLSPARIESILAAVKRVKEGRSLTVKQFQQLLGLMAAASNMIPFGLLYMRPLQWWLKSKGFSPRGNPLRMITRRGLRALVPKSGPGIGSSLPPRHASDRCIPHWMGSGHEWPPRPRSVDGSSSQLAHQLPRDAGRISSAEVLSPRPQRSPCAGPHRQHSGGLLYQPPGRSAVVPLIQAGAPDPCVVPGQTPLSSSSSHSWAFENGSRHPVETGAEARGMDASPRGGDADLGDLWASPIRSLCHEGECTLSPLVISSSSSSSVEAVGMAPEGAQLIDSGLSTEVVETILQSRAPSTRKLYALKWKLFTSWCGERRQDPANCPVGTVLEFLQARFSTGLAHSTLKVHPSGIPAERSLHPRS